MSLVGPDTEPVPGFLNAAGEGGAGSIPAPIPAQPAAPAAKPAVTGIPASAPGLSAAPTAPAAPSGTVGLLPGETITPIATPPPTTSPTTTPPTTTPPTGPTADQRGAAAIVQDYLNQWGLSSLADTVWQLALGGAGTSEIVLNIRGTQTWKDRFAGNVQLSAAGGTPLSETDYIARENAFRTQMQMGGLTPSFYSQQNLANLIGSNTAVDTVYAVLTKVYGVISQATPQTRQVFADLYGPASDNALATFLLSTTNPHALPELERMAITAQVGGAARQFGVASGINEWDRLVAEGLTPNAARTGFSQIADMNPLFTREIGDTSNITAGQEGIRGVLEGDAAALAAIRQRQGERVAAFDQTGSALTTQRGVVGVGEAR